MEIKKSETFKNKTFYSLIILLHFICSQIYQRMYSEFEVMKTLTSLFPENDQCVVRVVKASWYLLAVCPVSRGEVTELLCSCCVSGLSRSRCRGTMMDLCHPRCAGTSTHGNTYTNTHRPLDSDHSLEDSFGLWCCTVTIVAEECHCCSELCVFFSFFVFFF